MRIPRNSPSLRHGAQAPPLGGRQGRHGRHGRRAGRRPRWGLPRRGRLDRPGADTDCAMYWYWYIYIYVYLSIYLSISISISISIIYCILYTDCAISRLCQCIWILYIYTYVEVKIYVDLDDCKQTCQTYIWIHMCACIILCMCLWCRWCRCIEKIKCVHMLQSCAGRFYTNHTIPYYTYVILHDGK